MEEVKRHFRPEFLNRVDELIVFSSLNAEDLRRIVAIMLADVAKRLTDADLAMEATDNAQQQLVKEGSDFQYGARPLRRAIQKMVEDPISEMMLRKEAVAGDTIIIDADEAGKLTFTKKG